MSSVAPIPNDTLVDLEKDVKNKGSKDDIVVEDSPERISKFGYILNLLRKVIGTDLVSLRMSLPAHLLEPVSNLEFWCYNDRPDLFVQIPNPTDPLFRILNVLSYWFSRDTKWKDNQLRKPFNPILGEHFSCSWKVEGDTVRSVTEQISHHPPVAAFYIEAEGAGIVCRGLDHVVARFTGTALKVGPGLHNHGVYFTLKDGEEYNVTHPWATVNGILYGRPYIVVSENTIVSCPRTGLKAIVEYKEESMFGKPRFALEAKVFKHDFGVELKWNEKERSHGSKLKHVDPSSVLCTLTGAWNGQIKLKFESEQLSSRYASFKGVPVASEYLLFDMASSEVAPKVVKPISSQGPLESQRVWQDVVAALLVKDYTTATNEKNKIEDGQRKLAKERGEAYVHSPAYFQSFDVLPTLTSSLNMDAGKPGLKDGVRLVDLC